MVAPDRVLCMGQIELNSVFTLNLFVWNKTVLDIETVYLCYIELFEIEHFLHWNCVLILNWNFRNRNVYMYKDGFDINDQQWLICHKTKPNQANLIAAKNNAMKNDYMKSKIGHT